LEVAVILNIFIKNSWGSRSASYPDRILISSCIWMIKGPVDDATGSTEMGFGNPGKGRRASCGNQKGLYVWKLTDYNGFWGCMIAMPKIRNNLRYRFFRNLYRQKSLRVRAAFRHCNRSLLN